MSLALLRPDRNAEEPPIAAAGPAEPASKAAAIDAELLEILEADVMAAIAKVESAIDGATGEVAGARDGVARIRDLMTRLITATRGAADRTGSVAARADEVRSAALAIDRSMGEAGSRMESAVTGARTANGFIAELAQATQEIAGIVDTIAAVARQTNLLALNATIEAARAGAAGRGFAVVAGEVKALSVETSRAADDIRSRIGQLREKAGASISAVETVSGAVEAVRPVFIEVRESVGRQTEAVSELARDAGEASRFVDEVAARARETDEAAVGATAQTERAEESAVAANKLARALGERFTAVLRQNEIGDRRRKDRFPIELRARVGDGGRSVETATVDIGEEGVLVAAPEGWSPHSGAHLALELERVGAVRARVVTTSGMGVHCAFELADEATRARISDAVRGLTAEYAPLVQKAQKTAAAVSAAFEAALREGRVTREALFDTAYREVPDSDPKQWETRGLSVAEGILPGLLEPVLASDPRLVFVIAVDRNGWAPVHNKAVSQPQRKGDPVWNAANCRNKRIFDDRAGIAAARSTRPFLIQAYKRDMGGGKMVMLREIDAPIRVAGRHWGGLRTAYKL